MTRAAEAKSAQTPIQVFERIGMIIVVAELNASMETTSRSSR
jgi:hypothetical protein